MTVPILVGLDGKEKMSKSKGNYIGVTDSPGDMFGKVMSISDALMENYYTLLTDTPLEKIKELTDSQKTHPKQAKVLLAKTIVSQFYDNEAGDSAAEQFEKVFAQKQLPDEIQEFSLSSQPILVKQLLLSCKLVETGGEAKRMCSQSAVTIDGQKITDS
ncbi:MAG: tyrosine--tRNA ligase, partial [Sedimentisphaerales bacterium]